MWWILSIGCAIFTHYLLKMFLWIIVCSQGSLEKGPSPSSSVNLFSACWKKGGFLSLWCLYLKVRTPSPTYTISPPPCLPVIYNMPHNHSGSWSHWKLCFEHKSNTYFVDSGASKYSLKTLDTDKYVVPLICRMGIALQNQMEMSEVALWWFSHYLLKVVYYTCH